MSTGIVLTPLSLAHTAKRGRVILGDISECVFLLLVTGSGASDYRWGRDKQGNLKTLAFASALPLHWLRFRIVSTSGSSSPSVLALVK